VTFEREQQRVGMSAFNAAISAGRKDVLPPDVWEYFDRR
jgi:hypothetical protein